MKLPNEAQYPKSVLINNEVYRVQFVVKPDREKSTLGLCDPDKKVIRIKKGLSAKERMSTYVHEVLHAFEFEYEIDVHHDIVYALEECIINYLLVNH